MNNNTDKTSQGAGSRKTNWMLEAMEAQHEDLKEAQEREHQEYLQRLEADDEEMWEQC